MYKKRVRKTLMKFPPWRMRSRLLVKLWQTDANVESALDNGFDLDGDSGSSLLFWLLSGFSGLSGLSGWLNQEDVVSDSGLNFRWCFSKAVSWVGDFHIFRNHFLWWSVKKASNHVCHLAFLTEKSANFYFFKLLTWKKMISPFGQFFCLLECWRKLYIFKPVLEKFE